MLDRKDLVNIGLEYQDTYLDSPFHDSNWQLIRIKTNKKAFLWIYEKEGTLCVNLKADASWRDFWRNQYSSVVPAYHQNKEHWNTVIIDGTIPDSDIRKMIEESYDVNTHSATKRIYEAAQKIPYGKVATYGQVAEMAGDKNMARAVGNALHKNPDPENIPCFRVVNAKGELSGEFAFGGKGAQQKRLEEEGIIVRNGKVDLKQFGI